VAASSVTIDEEGLGASTKKLEVPVLRAWGSIALIGFGAMIAVAILVHGPFELSRDEDRDMKEMRESIGQLSTQVSTLITAQNQTTIQLTRLGDQLTYSVPLPAPTPQSLSRRRE
jgi:hypothetical protein